MSDMYTASWAHKCHASSTQQPKTDWHTLRTAARQAAPATAYTGPLLCCWLPWSQLCAAHANACCAELLVTSVATSRNAGVKHMVKHAVKHVVKHAVKHTLHTKSTPSALRLLLLLQLLPPSALPLHAARLVASAAAAALLLWLAAGCVLTRQTLPAFRSPCMRPLLWRYSKPRATSSRHDSMRS